MLDLLKKLGGRFNTERSGIRRATEALASARKEEAELGAKLQRLNAVIADAQAADATFREAVEADDSGAALAEFAEGKAPDGAIAKVVDRAQATNALAVAARAAAPKVQGRLEELRNQIPTLEQEKDATVLAYLRTRAEEAHQQYDQAWAALCMAYDQIVGMRRALVMAKPPPIQGPRLDNSQLVTIGLPPGMKQHTANGSEVEKDAHQKWAQARERLVNDVDANVDDLIGTQFQYESDRGL